MTPLISIVAVNIDSPEWAELLIKSIRMFTSNPYEIIVVDNNSLDINLEWLRAQSDIVLLEANYNLGHGGGIDFGLTIAQGRYVCALDIDAHLQRSRWDTDLLSLYHNNDRTRLIGCVGPEQKPLHPPLFFFERDFIRDNKIRFQYNPNGGPKNTDSCQQAYWDILDLGFEALRIPKGPHFYEGAIGDEVWLDGKPTIYHNWYGTRFNDNNPKTRKAELDGYKYEDHIERKRLLFEQPLVKTILGRQ